MSSIQRFIPWHLLRRKYRITALLAIVLIPAAFIILVPYLWMFTTSLKVRGTTGLPPYLFPNVFVFENYSKAWQAAPFLRYYLNTAFVAAAMILARVVFASMAAYAFAFLRFPGRNILFLLFLGTMMIPFQATIIPSYLIIRDLHWFNTYQALIVPRMVDAFSIFLLRQAFISLPRDYLDAAHLDGCSHWQALWRIVIPLNSSSVVTMALFTFLFAWNDFLWPLLVANNEQMRTIQVGLQIFAGRYQTEWTYMMAGTVTATLLPVIFFLAAQRSFISGMTRSGLKG
ncbi:MAG: carbohydrate ABC transporter permease [Chloroflexi bacterium]|nr:carbohydrate ABC transporter permease [Chloroflexota bacterium]